MLRCDSAPQRRAVRMHLYVVRYRFQFASRERKLAVVEATGKGGAMSFWIGSAAAQEATSPFTEAQQLAFMLLLGLVLTLGGLHFLMKAAMNVVRARRSRSWPQAQGTVTGHELRRPLVNGQGIATPRVQYEYSCDGTLYRNDEIMFGGHAPYGSALAQGVLDGYPVGSTVAVIHDPKNPQRSALIAKATLAAPLGYGLPFLAAGLLFLSVWAGTP